VAKKSVESVEMQTPLEQENILSLSCKTGENTKVKIHLNITSNEAAKQFGEMLFLLNEGYYVQSILDIFTDISKTDDKYAKFIHGIISSWSERVLEMEHHEKNSLDTPIISPTYFDKSAK
jgi:hypothetical protein